MDNTCAYKHANVDDIETFSCINKHDPRNWGNLEYNRDEGWSDSNDEFTDMELDSFSGSESGSKKFEFPKDDDQEETRVGTIISFYNTENEKFLATSNSVKVKIL